MPGKVNEQCYRHLKSHPGESRQLACKMRIICKSVHSLSIMVVAVKWLKLSSGSKNFHLHFFPVATKVLSACAPNAFAKPGIAF